jgi:hypothetical protein
VEVEPAHLDTMIVGTRYPVRLRFGVAPAALPQSYSGTIHVRVGPATISTPLPVVVNVDYGDITITPETHVLSRGAAGALASVTPTLSGHVLHFAGTPADVASLVPGDVLVINTCAATPLGFLGRVAAVDPVADDLQVMTTPAALEDVLRSGTIQLSKALAASDIQGQSARVEEIPGTGDFRDQMVEPESVSDAEMIMFYADDVVVYDEDGNLGTDDDQILADGSIGVGTRFDFTLGLDGGGVRYLRSVVTTSQSAELTFHVEVPIRELEREVTIGNSTYFSPIVVWAGFVPVVFVPQLRTYAEIEGSASAGIETSILEESVLSLGAQYVDGTWSPVSEFTQRFDWEAPHFTLGCEVKGSVGPQFNLLLYGVMGPYVDVKGYVELDVDVLPYLAWELWGGIEAGAGVRVDAFGRTLADEEFPTLVGFRTLLARSEVNPGFVAGEVTDALTRGPLGDVSVVVYTELGDQVASVRTGGSGAYAVSLAPGTYRLEFAKAGYLTVRYFGVAVVSGQTVHLEPVLQIDTVHGGSGSIAGQIRDALSGAGAQGITLDLRAGLNARTGPVVASTVTRSGGVYAVTGLAAGNYTAEIRGTGYLTSYFGVICIGGQDTRNQDATITPVLPPGQTRIVLTWGASPSDLDSHTSGPLPDGSRFHMYYPYAQAGGGSPWPDHVQLDLDDVTSYGPETTTLLQQIPGVYRFLVHDYTNRWSNSSGALSASGALVRVYRAGGLVASFPVPTGQGGTLWTIFEMDGDRITPVNTLSYTNSPGGIGVPFAVSDETGSGPDADVDWAGLPDKDMLRRLTPIGVPGARSGVTQSDAMPTAFALHAPTPNPVAGRTLIRFDLPEASTIDLVLFDVQGRLVRDLARAERLPAGRHVRTWDGRGQHGEPLQPGIYFLRLVAGGHEIVRRAVVNP